MSKHPNCSTIPNPPKGSCIENIPSSKEASPKKEGLLPIAAVMKEQFGKYLALYTL